MIHRGKSDPRCCGSVSLFASLSLATGRLGLSLTAPGPPNKTCRHGGECCEPSSDCDVDHVSRDQQEVRDVDRQGELIRCGGVHPQWKDDAPILRVISERVPLDE